MDYKHCRCGCGGIILDMIQEAYVNGHIDYQMPEDSEVVV